MVLVVLYTIFRLCNSRLNRPWYGKIEGVFCSDFQKNYENCTKLIPSIVQFDVVECLYCYTMVGLLVNSESLGESLQF
ncbi:MAG TPA: hypothetical protein DEH24_17710 [Alteromonas sp.]|nr:hypothetical protein [Aestuariibacter sp.]MAP19748.1 hypothetical protein [Alteromonadaceae bacterium]MAX44774.1 hypothetical protein [Alteromonadaceae bacterium]HBY41269.1 hypothetical protein [Alteromonas sp.]